MPSIQPLALGIIICVFYRLLLNFLKFTRKVNLIFHTAPYPCGTVLLHCQSSPAATSASSVCHGAQVLSCHKPLLPDASSQCLGPPTPWLQELFWDPHSISLSICSTRPCLQLIRQPSHCLAGTLTASACQQSPEVKQCATPQVPVQNSAPEPRKVAETWNHGAVYRHRARALEARRMLWSVPEGLGNPAGRRAEEESRAMQ